MKKIIIVTTTIHVPYLIEGYIQNTKYYNNRNYSFIIVGDKKTPTKTETYCLEISKKTDTKIEYLGVEKQKKYLTDFPKLNEHIPWNSVDRRNVGILKAYQEGAEIIITIDDDNLATSNDFLGKTGHGIVGSKVSLDSYYSTSGWMNVCTFLEEENNIVFYPRGYPIHAKSNTKNHFIVKQNIYGKVVVNCGLWLDEPDVDAITRMVQPVKVQKMKEEIENHFALYPGTWSPFNSQNTALCRTVIPAYFLSPYVGRYDDIWGSYVLRRIIDHKNELVTYGKPLVRQLRNPHDLFVDLKKEIGGMELTQIFCRNLRETELSGNNYLECYIELQESIEELSERNDLIINKWKKMLIKYAEGMKIWSESFNMI